MKEKRKRKFWTQPEVEYLKSHFSNEPTGPIAEHLGRTLTTVYQKANALGLKKSPEYLSTPLSGRLSKDHQKGGVTRFKKGQAAWNKGMKGLDLGGQAGFFPKGHEPHNTKKDGDVSIRKDNRGVAYRFVRIAKGVWKHEQLVRYEKANGPLLKGVMLRCKDGNQLNTDPSNWFPVTRKEHARLNHNQEKAYLNGPFYNLSDNYVATMATKKEPHLKEELKKHPELLDMVRTNMKLKREIKKQLAK